MAGMVRGMDGKRLRYQDLIADQGSDSTYLVHPAPGRASPLWGAEIISRYDPLELRLHM